MNKLDWNHLRALHATASHGSLSAAARDLGLTQPTLSRQIQTLENELGLNLFQRSGRRLVLTQAGHDLLEHVQRMGEAAESVALAASGHAQDISGQVRISATDSFSAYVLPEIVDRIRAVAPQITLVVISDNEHSNLHRMDADIAIRHAPPGPKGLVGQHVRDTMAHFYGSEDWVARNGQPADLEDLAKASLIGFGDTKRLADTYSGLGVSVEESDFRLVSSSAVVVWEMVKRGTGIAPMSVDVADRTPGVIRLCPDLVRVPVPIWLVCHRDVQHAPRIRLVQGVLAEALARPAPNVS